MNNQKRFEHQFTVNDCNSASSAKAVDIIAVETQLSKQRVKQAMLKGAVWLTSRRKTRRLRRASSHLQLGDSVHIYYDENLLNLKHEPPALIADETNYSVWYKPWGVLSQGSHWGDHCSMARWAEQHLRLHLQPHLQPHLQLQRDAFVVHRLDQAASGLIILAHNKKAAAALSELFQQRKIDKHYQAIVHAQSELPPQSITLPLDGKSATTHLTSSQLLPDQQRCIVDIRLETGRKHQIRRHLASIDFPIIGDKQYGNAADSEKLQLIAYRLSFVSPFDGKPKNYQLPNELTFMPSTATVEPT